MRAIPRKLLIHSAVLHRKTAKDLWGKESLGQGIPLEFVRVDPSSRIARDKNKAEIQIEAILFFDCRNSRPSNCSFCIDDILAFNGQKFSISAVEPLYDGEKLHHYELGLVKHA